VAAVDYRLAPAHVFPAALDDAFAAYRWAQTRADELDIDVSRIAVGGDSAGGSLAAGVCLMARDYGAAVPCGQLLVYPAVGAGEVTQSVLEFTDTPMCNSRDMEKYIKFYNPNCDSLSPQERRYSSPGEAEKLDGLPETYVETAEFDCLHDEGVLYAKRLEEEGIPVTLNETKGTIHGYDFMTKSEITRQSIQKRCEFLKKIFYSDREI